MFTVDDIKTVVGEIEGVENKERKAISLAETEIYSDDILKHVKAYLLKFYSEKTVNEMPFTGTINLAKRIVDQEASLYRTPPKRTFEGLSKQQIATINQVYQDLKLDQMLMRSNRMFKLQGQNHIQVLPFKNKLSLRILLNHHIDAIPDDMNPEIAQGYVISAFDKRDILTRPRSDAYNQKIADKDDYQAAVKKYSVWTADINTIVDSRGNSVMQDTTNPLGLVPIVEVSTFKDFTYWVQRGCAVTDFTIQFNATMSDLAHIVRMQGFAQAYLVSSSTTMPPENLQIGPNFLLKLEVDPNNPIQPQFGFANPNPDLQGSLRLPEVQLSAFLTSRGLSPKLVSGTGEADKFTSGLDRLLSMIERFEASQSDMEIYKSAEKQLLKIVCQYLNVYANAVDPTLRLNYQWTAVNPDSVDVSLQFAEPQSIMSEAEKLENIRVKKELGLMSDLDAIKEFYALDDEAARVKLLEIAGTQAQIEDEQDTEEVAT